MWRRASRRAAQLERNADHADEAAVGLTRRASKRFLRPGSAGLDCSVALATCSTQTRFQCDIRTGWSSASSCEAKPLRKISTFPWCVSAFTAYSTFDPLCRPSFGRRVGLCQVSAEVLPLDARNGLANFPERRVRLAAPAVAAAALAVHAWPETVPAGSLHRQ